MTRCFYFQQQSWVTTFQIKASKNTGFALYANVLDIESPLFQVFTSTRSERL